MTREYYVNDAGAQIDRFAASQLAAAKGEPIPEGGYAGAYIAEVAARVLWSNPGLPNEAPEAVLETFARAGVDIMLAEHPRHRSTRSACTSTSGSPSAR